MLNSFFMNDASWQVMMLLLVLVVMSVLSWAIILNHAYYLWRVHHSHQEFESLFWSGIDLASFYDKLDHKRQKNPTEEIFCAGFSTLLSHRSNLYSSEDRVSQCQTMMQLVQRKWSIKLQSQLAWLATIASVSPYVGLLGTVFGVMHTFHGLMQTQASTQLSSVAPGISEALAMTAFGLFVAIPATVAYNRLSMRLDGLLEYYAIFEKEFLVLVKKQRAI